MQVVQETGIKKPTRIRTDRDGKWMVVIQKDGDEIRNYKIEDVGNFSARRTHIDLLFHLQFHSISHSFQLFTKIGFGL